MAPSLKHGAIVQGFIQIWRTIKSIFVGEDYTAQQGDNSTRVGDNIQGTNIDAKTDSGAIAVGSGKAMSTGAQDFSPNVNLNLYFNFGQELYNKSPQDFDAFKAATANTMELEANKHPEAKQRVPEIKRKITASANPQELATVVDDSSSMLALHFSTNDPVASQETILHDLVQKIVKVCPNCSAPNLNSNKSCHKCGNLFRP